MAESSEATKQLTVSLADANFKLLLGGKIVGDFLYNSARPLSPGTPFYLLPRPSDGSDQQNFDAHARQTTLFAQVTGPQCCGFETGGLILVTLFNDALVVDRYGLLPILAYAEMKDESWRFAAGLQFDIFNPLNPTMLPFSLLAGSGNAGLGFVGQVRAERYLPVSPDAQITLIAGLSEPIATSVLDGLSISEDNGWPNVEGRMALSLGPLDGESAVPRRPFEVGVSGVVGQIRSTEFGVRQVSADVWGIGTDLRWAFSDRCGIQGEFFTGQTLGDYTAGILQDVSLITLREIRTTGGWGEFYVYLCPEKLHSHVGYGIDDPLDSVLGPTQPIRNETWFANLIWDVTKFCRLAGEVTYRRTHYQSLRDNDGIGLHTQVQYKF